jgi:hypothetical protein
MCRLTRENGSFNVGYVEGKLSGFIDDVQLRESYRDIWDIAQHALNLSVWTTDAIPPARPLVVPVYGEDKYYMRTSDLPEPARSAFEWRQYGSGRPCVREHLDACWIWDWDDWVNGRRGWI